MEEILELKRKIQNGENIGENYELLIKNVNKKLDELRSMESKLKKNTTRKIECVDINEIERDIDNLVIKNTINNEYISKYKNILGKINYLDDNYNTNITTIKKICEQNKKVILKKI